MVAECIFLHDKLSLVQETANKVTTSLLTKVLLLEENKARFSKIRCIRTELVLFYFSLNYSIKFNKGNLDTLT